jgi:hypothetical protein
MLQTLNIHADEAEEARPHRYGWAIRLLRLLLTLIGVVIALLGVLIAPLPGPLGLPVTVVGLMLVLRNSFWARRRFVRMQHRHPRWLFPLRRLLRKDPEIFPVLWQQTLRVERLLTPRKLRFLVRTRRRFRKRISPSRLSGGTAA